MGSAVMPARPHKTTADSARRLLLSPEHTAKRANGVTPDLIRELNRNALAINKGNEVLHAEARAGVFDCSQLNSFYDGLRRQDNIREIFRITRQFAVQNPFARAVIAMKKLLFMDGMTVTGAMAAEFQRAAPDLWTEWLTSENCIAAWVAARGEIPFLSVPKCEDVRYSDPFGSESLKIKFKPGTLTAAQKEDLGPRYTDAITKGSEIIWGTDKNEQFEALKASAVFPAGSAGDGLGIPGMKSVFEVLATHALLSQGDWNAAWTAKDVIRHIKRGHKIESGNLAGMPLHFLTKDQQKAIAKELEKRSGAFDLITIFDVLLEYPIFDFEYFTEEKWKGVAQRLVEWGGPVGMMLRGDLSQETRKLAHAEAVLHRKAIAGFIGRIAAKCGKNDVKVTFCPTTFLTWEEINSTVNSATSGGLMSFPTGREWLGLDDEVESKRMRECASRQADFTPPFEGKQGIVNNLTQPPPKEN